MKGRIRTDAPDGPAALGRRRLNNLTVALCPDRSAVAGLVTKPRPLSATCDGPVDGSLRFHADNVAKTGSLTPHYMALAKLIADGHGDSPEAVLLDQQISLLKSDHQRSDPMRKEPSRPLTFFLANISNCTLRNAQVSMRLPIFSLHTKPDMSVVRWQSRDGRQSFEVIPSVKGRATQHDKDILIFCISQLVKGLDRRRPDARCRTVRFSAHALLLAIARGVSGEEYRRLWQAFERLAGTRITTDVQTGGKRIRGGFGIIDSWRITEADGDMQGSNTAVEVTLSQWLYNAVESFEVLKLHEGYFGLRKPLSKRLYEIARKHCGRQNQFRIGLEQLRVNAGSTATLKEFKRMVNAIAKEKDALLEYTVSVDNSAKLADSLVVFRQRKV